MIFVLLSVFFLLATAAVAKVLYISIQPEQWLDKLFNWQTKLARWGSGSGWWDEYRYKAWGGCATCFSRVVSFWAFVVYVFVAHVGFDAWFHFDKWWVAIIVNFFYWAFYSSLSTLLNMMTILKLFK